MLIEALNKESALGQKVILAHQEWFRKNPSDLSDDWISESWDSDSLRAVLVELHDYPSLICLLESLFYARAVADSLDICREGLYIYPNDEKLLWWRDTMEEHMELKRKAAPSGETEYYMANIRFGQVYMREYPWMTPDELRRSDSLIEEVKNEFVRPSGGTCTIARTSLGGRALSTDDQLGVFATQDIREGDLILIERTPMGASTDPDSCPTCSINFKDRPPAIQAVLPAEPCNLPCCNDRYCSAECADLALNTFHPAICGKDLSCLPQLHAHDPHGTSNFWPLISRILLRCLASAIHTNTHPLQSSLLSRLKASYIGDHVLVFDFSNIRDSFKILQALNIDVFADLRFDTWVLHTIQCRIANNKSGRTFENGYQYTGVMPLYSFLNHDCEANCVHEEEFGHSLMSFIIARRHIKKGEEIFTSYLNDADIDLPWGTRQKLLFKWIRGECGCKRCIKEANKALAGL